MKPRELTEKEIKKLQKQFPLTKKELEKLKQIKKERLKNKLEILAIIFWLAILIGALYLFYLVWNYRFIGV
jgi:hypothetical protein